jgi:spore maturation protein SpmB
MRGARTALFLLRIILPLSFAVSLLDWVGLLEKIGRLLAPAMGTFGLPGEAALALVSGWLVGIYGGVAAMAIMPLSAAQVTVLSLMLLTAHNLPVESAVQHKTGTPWWLSLLTRFATAAVLGWICAAFLIPHGTRAGIVGLPVNPGVHGPFGGFLAHWAVSAGKLTLKIFVILLSLMLVTEWMRAQDIYHRLARPLKPVLSAMGLAPSVAFLWITAMVLGLAYGSGLLMEEAREEGRYRPAELRDLNISIGICHSVLEDTALLVAIGAGLFWITVPRLIAAAIVVRVTRVFARA